MTDRSRRILVLGLGLSGKAAAELAIQRGAEVTVLDENSGGALAERKAGLEARNAAVHLDWNQESWPAPVDLAVISPGVSPGSVLGRLAAALDCPVVSELEYGFQHAPCPVLAVTGTNGKSTTVELVNHCLKHAGYNTVAAGNIGVALCDVVQKHGALDFLVVEVSSYQIEGIKTFNPLAAALLNLSPDHLDRYRTTEEYYRAKMPIFSNMNSRERVVLRRDLLDMPLVAQSLPPGAAVPVTFSSGDDADSKFFLADDGTLGMRCADGGVAALCHRSELRVKGRHNIENVLAALGLIHAAGLDVWKAVPGAKTFPPNPHRLELVAVHEGIQFVNDSKSTNPDSLIRAIEAVGEELSGKILLLAGGLDKGLEFDAVKPHLAGKVREVFLIGRSRDVLAELWGGIVPCKKYASLANAFDAALESAENGDTVLLSPGCASQDMFRDYAERGEHFCELIRRRFGE